MAGPRLSAVAAALAQGSTRPAKHLLTSITGSAVPACFIGWSSLHSQTAGLTCHNAATSGQVLLLLDCGQGLGAPAGSMVAGTRAFVGQVHRLRKMLGGGQRQVGVLAAPGTFLIC